MRLPLFCGEIILALLAVPSIQAATFTVNVPAGLSTIANPFNHPAGNALAQVIPSVPEGTQIITFDRAALQWVVNQFEFGGWTEPQHTLNPGQGAFIRAPAGGCSITFTGTVPLTATQQIGPGFNLVSSALTNVWPSLPQEGDFVRKWNAAAQAYGESYIYMEGIGWMDGAYNVVVFPQPGMGESVVYIRSGGSSPVGAVYLNNYGTGINAPFRSTFGCIGTGVVAQLLVSTNLSPAQFDPVGDPVPLMSVNDTNGYVTPAGNLVRQLPPYSTLVQVALWDSRIAKTYAEAMTANAVFGRSENLLTEAAAGYPPANLPASAATWFGPLTPFPILAAPTNITVFEGESAEFVVTLLANGGYGFQWERQISGGTWTAVDGGVANRLALGGVTTDQAGTYRVIINALGCTNHILPPATLTVLARPRLELFPSNSAVRLQNGGDNFPAFAVEKSPDLSNWTSIATFTNVAPSWSLSVSNTGTATGEFFRVRLLR